jgi:dihydroxyacetone kinase-like predicted kinase
MSTAAEHTRYGAITVAESDAVAAAGRYVPGDVLGIVGGAVDFIGTSMAEVAWKVVEQLLGVGGELLTLVRGTEAGDDMVSQLMGRVRERFRTVDVEVVQGGQPRYPLLLGVE